MTNKTKHFEYSFSLGLSKLTIEQYREIKDELFRILGCNFASEFTRKKKHYKDVPKHIYDEVVECFAKYNIQETDVWTKKQIGGHGHD